MSDKSKLLVTVVFGKQSITVDVCTQDIRALDKLKIQIAEKFHLDPKFQRLVARGRDVNMSTVLTNGCKLLVLRNSSFYEKSAAPSAVRTSILESPVAGNSASKTVSKAPEIDVNELEDDVLLVQVFRGKSRYDVIFPRSKRILDVKKKVSAVLGLTSPQALKLVIKGKTPAHDVVLETLAGKKKIIKSMALLQPQQHAIQEKEEELIELLNELAGAQVALQRVQRQMARNFTSRDESLFELSKVLDDGQRIIENLELVKQHLAGSKTAGFRTSEQTLAAIMQAIEEANKLAETAQGLLERHSAV
ncbi:hypothetical protein DD238_003248 [Peronospora effusa]|uniref:Ubiquitin-like domain-containing protein n=1 Tax=Peronospora effusa TaxID=542832 RepID=A0A3M6VQS9_9STRA|nr:hypothetical protein DD238_003248 [Peronospora effusa]RQM09538.1 hypothetical protein DD237_007577 [Peronospora effusa]